MLLAGLTPREGQAGQAFEASARAGSGRVATLRPVYEVSTQGKTAGHVRVVTQGDELRVEFSYRENGRGPDLAERISLDTAGRVQAYRAQGRATFGAEIAEEFDFTAQGRVRWRSRVDGGDEPARAGEWFMPLEPSPAYTGLLTAAVLNQGCAPLTGGVALTAQVVHRMATTIDGAQAELGLVALHGLDVMPLWVWMERLDAAPRAPGQAPDQAAGAGWRFFGLAEGEWAVLPPGLQALAPALVRAQAAAKDRALQDRQAGVARPLAGLTLIQGVRWFDAPAARLQGPSDVWLLDGRIRAVTAPGQWGATPDHRIDGAGRTLIPGLFDMHGHVQRNELLMHLAFGVTTVRDVGNSNAELAGLRVAVRQGRLVGPSIVPLGFIEGASPFAASGGIVAASLAQALQAIDWYHARGYRQLKLYNSIKPQWVAPMVHHARALGLKVGGHVPAFMRAEEVVRAGYDEISHINQLMLNFVVRPGDDTRTLQRFTRVGDDAHAVDLSTPEAKRFLALLGRRRTVVDPTLVAFEAMYTQQQGEFNPSLSDMRDHLPPSWRRRSLVAELDLSGPRLGLYRGSWKQLLALTLAMHRAGAVVVPGTDGIAGAGLHRELALMVEAGFTPAEALRAATSTAAQVCGLQGQTGRIAAGMQADLVLVDGNPLQRITDLRRASLVIQGSQAFEPAAILRAMGFRPFVEGALGPL